MDTHNLRDAASIEKTLAELSPEIQRTEQFSIRNDAPSFKIILALAEGYDESGEEPPAGYKTDTGLTVTGQNVMPGTTQSGFVQAHINVLATHAKCSVRWKRLVAPFDEGNLNLADRYAPAGKFFVRVGWAVVQHDAELLEFSDVRDREAVQRANA